MQGQHENRIYELKMECGPNYPKEPPVFHFVSQINLPGVNQHDGRVDQNAVGILRDWERIATELSKNPRPKEDPLSLEAALIAIRKSVQPGSSVTIRREWANIDLVLPVGTWTSTRSCLSLLRAPSMLSTSRSRRHYHRNVSKRRVGRHRIALKCLERPVIPGYLDVIEATCRSSTRQADI